MPVYIHTYNGIVSSHKKEWKNDIWGNMDGPRDYHIKWSKSHNNRQIRKNNTNELIHKINRFTDIENKLIKRGRDGGLN